MCRMGQSSAIDLPSSAVNVVVRRRYIEDALVKPARRVPVAQEAHTGSAGGASVSPRCRVSVASWIPGVALPAQFDEKGAWNVQCPKPRALRSDKTMDCVIRQACSTHYMGHRGQRVLPPSFDLRP